jgi:hypothetical protein
VNKSDPDGFWQNDKFVYQKPGWLRWFAFQMGIVLKKLNTSHTNGMQL